MKKYMECKEAISGSNEREKEYRGVVNIRYLNGVSEKFKRI